MEEPEDLQTTLVLGEKEAVKAAPTSCLALWSLNDDTAPSLEVPRPRGVKGAHAH